LIFHDLSSNLYQATAHKQSWPAFLPFCGRFREQVSANVPSNRGTTLVINNTNIFKALEEIYDIVKEMSENRINNSIDNAKI
jgi:hypothetical protein